MFKFLKISLMIIIFIFSNSLAIENKIILKVEDEIITSIDVYSEITSLKFFNKNINQLKDEEIYQIALQSITKYKIKKKEVVKNFGDIKFKNDDYLNSIIEKTYKDLGFQNLEDFKNILQKYQISFSSFIRSISWLKQSSTISWILKSVSIVIEFFFSIFYNFFTYNVSHLLSSTLALPTSTFTRSFFL